MSALCSMIIYLNNYYYKPGWLAPETGFDFCNELEVFCWMKEESSGCVCMDQGKFSFDSWHEAYRQRLM